VNGAAEAKGERLQKVLSQLGVASRRRSEELIAAGRVTVNGRVARLGQRIRPERDHVCVDGRPIGVAPERVYWLLHKPKGVLSSVHDPLGRPVVVQFVPRDPKVFPVGRLDADSEGLIILTNDGALAYLLTHPSFEVEKEYLVKVEGVPSPGALAKLRQGVALEDGRSPSARVGVLGPGLLRIVVHEGRKRVVRRMCEAVGYPVQRLIRTRIGPLRDPSLRPGEFRELEIKEVRALSEAAMPHRVASVS
jgi:23S rRNA pseudouridine2605 synthase